MCRQINVKILLKLHIFFIILQQSWGWFESCSKKYDLKPNQEVTVISPNYPKSQYPRGSSCLHYFKAPSEYTLQLSCSIDLVQPNGKCSTEFFYVSTDGNQQLSGSEFLCGKGNIVRTSIFNELSIGYTSSATNVNQQTGTFTCKITARAQACDCGWNVNSKIVGGSTTYINEFVSMVGIVYIPGTLIFCGGSIIHFRYILTAAHCFIAYTDASKLGGLVGDQDYKIGTDAPYSSLYKIRSIIRHGSYNQNTQKNDIALLQTIDEMIWKRGVGPACLPFNYNGAFSGATLDVAGWGSTSFGGPTSNTLRKVSLNIQTNSYCKPSYSNIDDTQMCSYTPNKDTCQYDSGGSLYYRPNNRLYTIGIVSYGGACGGLKPAVNTRVSAFISWIQQITGVSFCRK